MDPGTRRNFWDLIYTLADGGVTVFVTTHYMEEAEYCNRIGLIDRGQLIALGSPGELKSKHLAGTIYEIGTDHVLAAAEALAHAEGVLDAAVFGRSLHVRLKQEIDAQAYLPSFLNSSGLLVNSIRPIEPSLEDVFVALVGRKARATLMSIRRIKALTRKEFIQMSRDIRSLMGALFNPLLMIFLFGYALSLDVDRIPTVVLDFDGTPVSREFIHRLTDSRYFTLVRYLERDGDVDSSLARGEALMALVIPRDFASKVKQGIKAPLQVVFDGSDSNTATIALRLPQGRGCGF